LLALDDSTAIQAILESKGIAFQRNATRVSAAIHGEGVAV